MFQGSASAADSLILFFGAAVLGLSPALIGFLDAARTIALSLGAIGLALGMNHIRQTDKLFVVSLAGVGLSLVLFATVGTTELAIVLAIVFGLVIAPAGVLAPVLASRQFPHSSSTRAFSYLNQASSLGGALGIGLGAAWLALGDVLGSQELAIRMLFIGIGVIAIVGAFQSYSSLRLSRLQKQPAPTSAEYGTSKRFAVIGVNRYQGVQLPMLNDQMVFHLLFSCLLFIGLGMAFTGIHIYLLQDLRVSVAVAMVAIMGFKLASYLASPLFHRGFAQLLPVQVISMATIGRSIILLSMPIVALLMPPNVALPVVILLIALWGVSSGSFAISGIGATAQLALRGRLRESMALYVAVAHAGAISGAWLGGAVAGMWGFESMFLLAAGISLLASILMLRN